MFKFPSNSARKAVMGFSRIRDEEPDIFFIDHKTGDIRALAYSNDTFPTTTPNNTYIIHIEQDYWLTYKELNKLIINQINQLKLDRE